MYYFILHLSLADLITAFFNVAPQLAMELTWPEFLGGNVFCKFIKYMQILGPYASSYVLVMTALDRYQAICYPLTNCSWTARQSKLMIGFAWGIAILFCTPQVFVFSLEEVAPGVYDCWATFTPSWGAKVYVTWYCLSIFIVPLGILVFAYTCICRAIWINANMKNTVFYMETTSDIGRARCNSYTTMTIINLAVIANGNANGQWNDRVDKNCKNEEDEEQNEVKELMYSDKNGPSKIPSRFQIFATTKRPSICPSIADSIATQPRSHSIKGISTAKIKTVKLTVTVILCYIVASTPFIVAELWSTYDPLAHTSPFYTGTVFTILTLLASLNSCINPWIFLFFNPNLLQDFMLGCRRNCCYIGRRQSGAPPVTRRTSMGYRT
jgi:arginine vasopressin receptor 1A